MRLKTHLSRIAFFFILGYGFLYFSYKWLDPTQVNTDFIQYYGMIQHPFNFHAAPSPWVYRQWNAVVAHLIWRLHIYYPNAIRFQDPHYDQRIFFAALLTNFLSIVVTAWLCTLVVDRWLVKPSRVLPLLAGMLCFFSFYLQETTITGQADGLSWALISLCYLLYTKRSLFPFCAVLLISILQREILPIIFFVFASTELLTARKGTPYEINGNTRRFLRIAASWSIIAFSSYLLLRHFIHAPGNEYQTDQHAAFHQLLAFRPNGSYIMQVFVGQNLFILLIAVWLLLFKRYRVYSRMLLPLAASCVALVLVSILADISNNAGRMLALLTPIVVVEITMALILLDADASLHSNILPSASNTHIAIHSADVSN